jgi:hypothetical protein
LLIEKHKEIVRVKGKDKSVEQYDIFGKAVTLSGNVLRVAQLKNEYFEDVESPQDMVNAFIRNKIPVDIFTFWQRLPNVEPKFNYHMEYEKLAVLEFESYDNWFKNVIDSKTRNTIRKSEKKGAIVNIVDFNDVLVNGIVEIYNETPIRQGKPFWHYGKSFTRVKEETSDALGRSVFLGAYYNEKLIGFVKLLLAEKYAMIVLILSMIAHRDKATQNALIAKSVEVCCKYNKNYLIYADWNVEKSLADFKINSGFKPINLPRYYIPLTFTGNMAIRLNLHHGIVRLIPKDVKYILNKIRVGFKSINL